ncbi:MAG: response regulator [Thermoleophilia bacterium]|nr:response regulator [Thermoleophilia bacterium]
METKPILVVDDEKSIRLTLAQALEPLGFPVETAINGEEALAKLEEKDYGMLLLDLKMPGMDGLEVLHRIRERRPRTYVIIITAHGTIESAVEAMKLGAVDFIRKPFSPAEVRELVRQVFDRETLIENDAADYRTLIELCKHAIQDRRFEEAGEIARRAMARDPAQPEAFNLFGALLEIEGDSLESLKFYRAALDIDPTYQPARANLERAVSWPRAGEIGLGGDEGQAEPD